MEGSFGILSFLGGCMNKEELKEALMEYSDKNDVDLPAGWASRGETKLKELLEELTGVQPDVKELANVAVVGKQPVSEQNPFGEEIVKVMIPIDKQNPKKRLYWASINCKPLYFPIGKIAHMPMSYYLVYMNNLAADIAVQQKMMENAMKEI